MQAFGAVFRYQLRGQFRLLIPALVLLSGCATMPSNSVPLAEKPELPIIQDAPAPKNDLNDSGSDLSAIPIEVNRMVLKWIDYFQGPGRPHMDRYLSRSARYMPIMKKILKENGLPEDLIYIALIESGFSSSAKSTASAVGYWQFIRGTGKRYNLQIDNYVDERRDFEKSTQAAADYFKGLYNLFGAWYLAIASYNVGENRVKSVVMKYHTRDFWQLARENKLPQETVNYVPKFLAARLIAKNPEKYGFGDVEYMPALAFNRIELKHSVDLKKMAEVMQIDYDDLRDLNPSFKKGLALAKKDVLRLRVPPGLEEKALAAAPQASASQKTIYVADEDYSYYRVRKGETLSVIAQRFGTSVAALRKLNRLPASGRIIAGQRIRVPGEIITSARRASSDASPKVQAKVRPKAQPEVQPKVQPKVQTVAQDDKKSQRTPAQKKKKISVVARQRPRTLPAYTRAKPKPIHIVRRGDTLFEIAQQYRVSVGALAKANNLPHGARIQKGIQLVIPQ